MCFTKILWQMIRQLDTGRDTPCDLSLYFLEALSEAVFPSPPPKKKQFFGVAAGSIPGIADLTTNLFPQCEEWIGGCLETVLEPLKVAALADALRVFGCC